MEFKIDDIVEAFGLRGKVIKEIESGSRILVYWDDIPGYAEWFYHDGKESVWHKEPSLKLIERPKKMVKKKFTRWVNYRNKEPYFGTVYSQRNEAIANAKYGSVTKEISFEIEVEE